MKRINSLFFIFFIGLFILSEFSFADGCFFGYTDVYEPSQIGIIVSNRGEEDLVLFVNAKTKASDFAWVVPVPSYPKIYDVSIDLLFELGELTYASHNEFLPFSCGAGVVPLSSYQNVHVWEEMNVGIYKVSILSSENADSLSSWLSENGYNFPKEAESILDYYINKKFFFIAMKVRKNAEIETSYDNPQGLQPIWIHFATDRPVYPLKISSISADSNTELLLYVFGNRKINYPGFSVEFSKQISPNDYKDYKNIKELLISKSFYLTKLRAILTPEEMTSDLDLSGCVGGRAYIKSIFSIPLVQLLGFSLITIFLIKH